MRAERLVEAAQEKGSAAVGVTFAVLMAMVVVMSVIPLLTRLARRVGLVDEPDCRKQHEGCIPLIGGLAMYCGIIVGLCLLFSSLWLLFLFLVFGGLLL